MNANGGTQSREQRSTDNARARHRRGGRRLRTLVGAPVALVVAFIGAAALHAAPTSGTGSSAIATWQLLPPAPIDLGSVQTSAWTGREVLLTSADGQVGAAYNPISNSWRRLPGGLAPTGSAQGGSFSSWTGKEMLVSGQGLREGVLLASLSDELPDEPLVRATSIAALAQRFRGWSLEVA